MIISEENKENECQRQSLTKHYHKRTKRSIRTPSSIKANDSELEAVHQENIRSEHQLTKRIKLSKLPEESKRKFGRERNGEANKTGISDIKRKRKKAKCKFSKTQNGEETLPISSSDIIPSTSHSSHPGIIKSLQLTNFMCHAKFTHNFHQNLNFITGQNGSGKSALLTGILIALGGKASSTNRTTCLKSLVQKGKHTGRVAVTLLNTHGGLRSYGNEITIERWVNASGGGGYRIKSTADVEGEDGKHLAFNWRPLKKPELDRILLGLNIQIDNPVAVLNQEVARSFLRSKDPKVKFNLFYDGTLLSKLEAVIGETKEDLEETGTILAAKREVINAVKKEVIHLKQKCEKIAELDEMKERMARLHQEYLWAVVVEQEKIVEETNRKMEVIQKEMEVLSEKLEDMEQEFGKVNEEHVLSEHAQVQTEIGDKRQERRNKKIELLEVRRNHTHLKTKLTILTNSVDIKKRQIQQLSDSIDKLKAEQDAVAKEETSQDEEMLSNLEGEKKYLEEIIEEVTLEAECFKVEVDSELEQLHKLEKGSTSLRTEIEIKNLHIAALSHSGVSTRNRNKNYSAFGPKMEQLMAIVQSNLNKFKIPPRGPLGALFKGKNEQSSLILEEVLWRHLTCFVVGDPRDLHLLRRMIDSVYSVDRIRACQQRRSISGSGSQAQRRNAEIFAPTIYYMRYRETLYNTSRSDISIHPNARRLIDLIEVEDNDQIVMNALMEIAGVDKQLVFKNNSGAIEALKDETVVSKSLMCAYTLQWYRITPAPNFSVRAMRIRNRDGRAKIVTASGKDKENQIKVIKSEIIGLEEELKIVLPRRMEIKENEKRLREGLDMKMGEITGLKRKLREIMQEIKRHLAKMKERERRHCDLSSYYEELEELQNDLKQKEEDRNRASVELDPIATQLEELETSKKSLDDQVEELNSKLGGYQETLDKLRTRRREMDNIMKKMRTRVASLAISKTTIASNLKENEDELHEKMVIASNSCAERVDTERSPTEVKKEFEATKIQVEETVARLGDVIELRANLLEMQQKFTRLKQEFVPLYKMYRIVQQTSEDQHASFERLKAHMGRTLTYFFACMAKQRGYEGRLLLDFSSKELYYFVCPDGDAVSKTLKAVDAQEERQSSGGGGTLEQLKESKALKKAMTEYSLGLSGGERSFATICFIMALWQVMECPFYMLDEFDVFMDAFNRKTSQLALMAHAKRFCQNQFVLFTPLEISPLPAPQDASVLRLFPPVRSSGANVNCGGAGLGNNASNVTASQEKTVPIVCSDRNKRNTIISAKRTRRK